jgi:hypothetical protein
MQTSDQSYSTLVLKQVVFEIQLPDCHPTSRARIVSQLTKRQLKQFQSDTLQVYVLTNPPRLSLLAMPKTQDKIYLFADDINVADACAHQFYADALARLQTLEPNAAISNPEETESNDILVKAPYRVVSLVGKARAVPAGTESVVDLMELEAQITRKADPLSYAIFVPDEYPALVWLDLDESDRMSDASSTRLLQDREARIRTLVYPSGAIVVNGTRTDEMDRTLRHKLPLIQRCMRGIPESIASILTSRNFNS